MRTPSETAAASASAQAALIDLQGFEEEIAWWQQSLERLHPSQITKCTQPMPPVSSEIPIFVATPEVWNGQPNGMHQ